MKSMNPQLETNFLHDLVTILIENVNSLKEEIATKKQHNEPTDWETGQVFGFYRALSLIEQQAEAFCIPKHEIGFEGFSVDSIHAP
jgi:hypothetical protein